MKEYTSMGGGRYTYIDDITNLQDIALSITNMFDGCGNFIISGCEILENSLTSGYVYINGRIRYCEGLSVIKKTDASFVYICERNIIENVAYAESGDKAGRISFGCYATESLPDSMDLDPVTGQYPGSIIIYKGKSSYLTPRLHNAFFGKYAVMADNHDPGGQTINNNLLINGKAVFSNSITAKEYLSILRYGNEAFVTMDPTGSLVLRNMTSSGKKYDVRITKNGEFQMWSGEQNLISFNKEKCKFYQPISVDSITAGSISLNDIHLYNSTNASDSGELNINLIGYNKGRDYFRITNIGDGKGNVVLSINGKRKVGVLNGKLLVKSPEIEAIEINASKAGSSPELQNYMVWKDVNGAHLMKLGYLSLKDNSFYISNSVGSVTITSDCNVSGTLRVQGKDIMETLVVNSNYKKDMDLKADKANVYSKKDADNRFLKLSGEFTELVNHIGGDRKAAQKKLRQQIDAVGNETVPEFAHNAECLADVVFYGIPREPYPEHEQEVARLEAVKQRQEQVRKHIGAATDWASYDSGIQKCVPGTNLTSPTTINARKIGRTVMIQGSVSVLPDKKDKLIFTIPESIPVPAEKIFYDAVFKYTDYVDLGKYDSRVGFVRLMIGGENGRQCILESKAGTVSGGISFIVSFAYFA